MQTREFDLSTFQAPERAGRPSKVIPILELAVSNGATFAVPVYTSSKNKVSGSEQIQSSRVIAVMRSIAPKWRYAYHEGETLEIIFIPPKMKVDFDTKDL